MLRFSAQFRADPSRLRSELFIPGGAEWGNPGRSTVAGSPTGAGQDRFQADADPVQRPQTVHIPDAKKILKKPQKSG